MEAPAKACPFDWFPDAGWHDIDRLVTMDALSTLAVDIEQNETEWKAWYDLEA
eukprot:SAG25_NODE_629_length_6336_cov_2.597884_1_plen_52_part_10